MYLGRHAVRKNCFAEDEDGREAVWTVGLFLLVGFQISADIFE